MCTLEMCIQGPAVSHTRQGSWLIHDILLYTSRVRMQWAALWQHRGYLV